MSVLFFTLKTSALPTHYYQSNDFEGSLTQEGMLVRLVLKHSTQRRLMEDVVQRDRNEGEHRSVEVWEREKIDQNLFRGGHHAYG